MLSTFHIRNPGMATLHLPYHGRADMSFLFAPVGGGSRIVSLWEMLRFYADMFVEVINGLNLVETMLGKPEIFLRNKSMVDHYAGKVNELREHLEETNLKLSAKKASELYYAMIGGNNNPEAYGIVIKQYSAELRSRIADELEGRVFYYVSEHVELLSNDLPFGEAVDDAFPSARYDIAEAGRCLALRRSTACVVHLMRLLEASLASLADALSIQMTTENWNTILNDIENEIRSRNKTTHGEAWKNKDEPFFAEAATHFRFIKNAWRNHAAHGRVKYTDEEAQEIYDSVRSFMRHLSERLSEEGQSS